MLTAASILPTFQAEAENSLKGRLNFTVIELGAFSARQDAEILVRQLTGTPRAFLDNLATLAAVWKQVRL